MYGAITLYSDITGIGQVVEHGAKKSYSFEILSWVYSNNFPEKDMEVEFELDGGRVSKITEKSSETLAQKIKLAEEKKKKKAQALQDDEEEEDEHPFPEIGITEIKPNLTYEQALELYFDNYAKKIEKNISSLSQNRVSDYFLVRRFLMTAYNNLTAIDSKIAASHRLREISNEFDEIQAMYRELVKFTKVGKSVLFEKAYLENQADYLRVKKEKDNAIERLATLTRLESDLSFKLEEMGQKIANKTAKSEKEALESAYKEVKGKYVDTLQEISRNREKIIYIDDMLKKFIAQNIEGFFKPSKEHMQGIGKKLLKLLDAMAFEFDYILWDVAKNSHTIRHKFAEAHIEGSYCTKTFMKYYLSRLDRNKLTEHNQKLVELQEEMEKDYKKLVAISTYDSKTTQTIRTHLEFLNKDFRVESFFGAKELLSWVKKHEPDVIFVSYSLRGATAIEFLKAYFKAARNVFTDAYVICKENETHHKEALVQAGARHILREPEDEVHLKLFAEKLAKYM